MSLDDVERRSWFWCMNSLHKPRPGIPVSSARLVMPVADTILYKDNEPCAWLFTSKETGEVLRRHTRHCRTELAVQAVMRKSLSDAAAAGVRLCHSAVVRKGTDTSPDVKATLYTEEDMLSAAGEGGGLTSNLLALQACVHGRAGSGTRYRADVRREPSGLAPRFTVNKLSYLGAPTGADVPHPRSVAGKALNVGPAFSLKCTMTAFNAQLHQLCADLVSHYEAVGRTRVVRMQSDFVLDAATGQPVLVSV